MKVSSNMRLDLPLIVRMENVIKRQVVLIEPSLEPFPDCNDLRIISYCAEQQSLIIHKRSKSGQWIVGSGQWVGKQSLYTSHYPPTRKAEGP